MDQISRRSFLKGAGGVTALCPVESRLYLGLAGSEKVRSANL